MIAKTYESTAVTKQFSPGSPKTVKSAYYYMAGAAMSRRASAGAGAGPGASSAAAGAEASDVIELI